VIGAGGAARAAAFGLGERGADVFIMNRTPAKGQKLAKEAKAKYLGRGDLRKHRFDVIINATPVGMNGNASPLSEKEIKANYVFDMVYTSLETPFTRAGRAAGAQVIPGYEMFVQQGVQQFQIWTAKPAPAAEMQNVVLAAVTANARLAEHSNGERAQADQPKEAKPKPEKTKAEKVKPAKVQAAKAKAPKPAPSKAKPKSKAKK
jgi:3-dehydroquinate dehydratase/shikimate dehydrogenase